jgi:hypothetical protein
VLGLFALLGYFLGNFLVLSNRSRRPPAGLRLREELPVSLADFETCEQISCRVGLSVERRMEQGLELRMRFSPGFLYHGHQCEAVPASMHSVALVTKVHG